VEDPREFTVPPIVAEVCVVPVGAPVVAVGACGCPLLAGTVGENFPQELITTTARQKNAMTACIRLEILIVDTS
jgi:hypothetical protein